MGGVSTQLSIQDRMTNRLNSITSAFNRMIGAARSADVALQQVNAGQGITTIVPVAGSAQGSLSALAAAARIADAALQQVNPGPGINTVNPAANSAQSSLNALIAAARLADVALNQVNPGQGITAITVVVNSAQSSLYALIAAARLADVALNQINPGQGLTIIIIVANNAEDSLNDITTAANSATAAVQQTGSGLSGLLRTAMTVFSTTMAFKLTFGGALEMDSIEREFQARLGDDVVGSALFDSLEKQAQSSAFSLEELAKNTSSFMSMTTDPKQMQGLNQIAEQLAVFDKTGQGLEGAGFSLKEALSGDIVSLAERFNMSKSQIRAFGIDEMGKSGDVEGFIRQFNLLLETQNMGAEAYAKMLQSPKVQLNMFLSNMKTGFASASQSALTSLIPLIMCFNEWFKSDSADAFFTGVGNAVSTVANTIMWVAGLIGSIASFVSTNWSVIEPIIIGIAAGMLVWNTVTMMQAGAAMFLAKRQAILNVKLLGFPVIWIVVAIMAIVAAFAYWVKSVGGLKVAWLVTCNALLTSWDVVKIGFMTGVYWVMDLWDKLQLCFSTVGVNIANFMGDMKVNVLSILQSMVNGAINIINGFINTLNKVPGVSMDLVEQVTFATTAHLENDAEKQLRNQELADYRSQIDGQISGRGDNITQMKAESQIALAQRQADIAVAKMESAQKNSEKGSDTSAWDNYQGNSNVGSVDSVGSVGGIEDDVRIAGEDLKFMRDVAEMRYVQNFVTLTPTVAVNANISKEVDADEIIRKIEYKLENEFVAAAAGVYN